MDNLIKDTSETITRLLESPMSLRDLSTQLFGTPSKAGLLADVRDCRTEHVSFTALQDLRQRLALRYQQRHVIDLYADEDAAVHLLPGGKGQVTVHHVPDGATVVIVPPGARIVQQAARRDTRARWRVDLTAYAGRITSAEIRRLIDEQLRKPG